MDKRPPGPGRDLHQQITDNILAQIDAGPGEPQMPWRRAGGALWIPKNAENRSYSGINIVNLLCAAQRRGFALPIWGTYRQWQEQGAQVKRGAKAELVVFFKAFETRPDPQNEDDDGKRRVARSSSVFNIQEVEGATLPPAPPLLPPIERLEAAERFIAHTGARIVIGGDQAFYSRANDEIHMPPEGLFTGTDTMERRESLYATELHELAHWSGHPKRCDRPHHKKYADEIYIKEELIAEISAAILCAELQITQDTRPDHAAYIQHWAKLLGEDKKAIFYAAARASEAVNYLKGLQPCTTSQHYAA